MGQPVKVPMGDFAPDRDPLTPGILLDVEDLYPTVKGYRSYPSLTQYATNELPGEIVGAWSGAQGQTVATVAATFNQLYVLDALTWVSSALTINGTDTRWRFDLYGNDLIAVNGVDPAYVYTGTGAFTLLGGTPPIASLVQATDYSVFLIEPHSNTWHSTLSDILWTDSIATQTCSGNLDSTTGNITAAHALRSGIALFKRHGLHYSTFAGPPFYWDFNKVSHEVGAPCQEAVANLGDVLRWPGPDDFYSFDSYSLQPIPNNLKEWFFANLDQLNDFKIAARWDQARSLVFWHFPSNAANPPGSLDKWICLNTRTGKWSKGSAAIDVPIFRPIQTGHLDYDIFSRTYVTYGGIPVGLRYGDLRSRTVDVSGAFPSASHGLSLFNGAPNAASFTTGDFGDRHNILECMRIRPQYTIYPTEGATLTPLNQSNPGHTPVPGTSRELSTDGWFNLRNTSRLMRFEHTGDSEYEIVGLEAELDRAGDR
jgi:hypothetical protein